MIRATVDGPVADRVNNGFGADRRENLALPAGDADIGGPAVNIALRRHDRAFAFEPGPDGEVVAFKCHFPQRQPPAGTPGHVGERGPCRGGVPNEPARRTRTRNRPPERERSGVAGHPFVERADRGQRRGGRNADALPACEIEQIRARSHDGKRFGGPMNPRSAAGGRGGRFPGKAGAGRAPPVRRRE